MASKKAPFSDELLTVMNSKFTVFRLRSLNMRSLLIVNDEFWLRRARRLGSDEYNAENGVFLQPIIFLFYFHSRLITPSLSSLRRSINYRRLTTLPPHHFTTIIYNPLLQRSIITTSQHSHQHHINPITSHGLLLTWTSHHMDSLAWTPHSLSLSSCSPILLYLI